MAHERAAPIARHRAHQVPIRHHCSVASAQGAGNGRIDFPISRPACTTCSCGTLASITFFSRYEALGARGILPVRAFNHGPGTSFYYLDPDGNTVELSAANFVRESDYLAYFQSETYRRNVSGIEINVAEYVARYRAGTPQEELVRIE